MADRGADPGQEFVRAEGLGEVVIRPQIQCGDLVPVSYTHLDVYKRQTLACSSMSQIGFILVGTAMQGFLNGENALAAWGTVLHMLNHSLSKLVLFVAAGVVYLGTHSLNLNDIRGWGRNKQVL